MKDLEKMPDSMAAEIQSVENNRTALATVALRGLTVFPQMLLHFDVGRDASIKALEAALERSTPVFLVAQRDMSVEAPRKNDLFDVGTLCHVRQLLRLPGGGVRVMVEGICRGRLYDLIQRKPYLIAQVERLEDAELGSISTSAEALMRHVYEQFESYCELSGKLSTDILLAVLASENPGYIADHIAQNMFMRTGEKQSIMDELRPVQRLKKLSKIMEREIAVLELEFNLQSQVRENMSQTQRDHYLREQMRVISQELGESGGGGDEVDDYRVAIFDAKLPAEVHEKLVKEVGRLERQPFGSSEATVIRSYLDVCLEMPWSVKTKEKVDVDRVRKTLDADHFGMEKVKERILEFVSVRQLAPDLKGQIICLVGPPGVGKTSIAMSVAKALGRKLSRISLGGVHDEAEIRGHRKTYVGAMPGRIINGIKQAGSCNPLMLLDEIDKVGADHRGDPAAALLEVLDAEQNDNFRDHFLEIPFDLSEVMFITTANTTATIPRPLLDRMEVIELSSYTDEEKLQITKRHLLPKQLKRHGLKRSQLKLSDDAIRALISGYTRESGVRVLERELASLCRKTAKEMIEYDVKSINFTPKKLQEFAGPVKYHPEKLSRSEQVGLVNGLAWTQVGGELLEVEVNVVAGSGKVELTGNLGAVMKESAQAAFSYIRSRASALGLEQNFYKKYDIHVHFPEGAVPKDGPSAGIAITTAMVSALTNTPVKTGIAMTGEVTLRGRVLPIGGLKEKTMAALRNGIHTVIIPSENESDLQEIDQTVRSALHFVPVEQVDAVLFYALSLDPKVKHAGGMETVVNGKQSSKGNLQIKQ